MKLKKIISGGQTGADQGALSACLLALTACAPSNSFPLKTPTPLPPMVAPVSPASTPLPTRPSYAPGELVDYTAQPYESFIAVTLLYLLINVTVMSLMRVVEAKTRVPGYIGGK